MALKDLLSLCLWEGGECVRPDIIVRYMNAEALIDGAEHNIPLYTKLSERRKATMKKDGAWQAPADFDANRARNIIRLLRAGWEECPVVLGRDGKLIDGAHRIATAMAMPQDVWVVVWDREGSKTADGWFENNFTAEEWACIKNEERRCYEQYMG